MCIYIYSYTYIYIYGLLSSLLLLWLQVVKVLSTSVIVGAHIDMMQDRCNGLILGSQTVNCPPGGLVDNCLLILSCPPGG